MSRLHDGKIAIRGGRIMLIPRKAVSVVAVNVAPDGPRNLMKWLREKPALVTEIPQIQSTGNHYREGKHNRRSFALQCEAAHSSNVLKVLKHEDNDLSNTMCTSVFQ
ncbi:MAG: hypothetical protein DRN30_05155 [Thermoplasmata archaeon]|nr:MAG: hypothetical protein DRN30_05155 [Thermoplasmata archaeon]